MRRLLFFVCLSVFLIFFFQGAVTSQEDNLWQYVEKRSSGKPELTGELFFKGLPIPDNLRKEGVYITTGIGTYRFFARKDPSGSGGFLREGDTLITDAKNSSLQITEEDLNRHFYEAGFYDRKEGTPTGWVYIRVDNNEPSVNWTKEPISLWVDPAFFAEVMLESKE